MSRCNSPARLVIAAIGLNVLLVSPAIGQVCSKPPASYDVFGDVVVDKVTKLAWKRCSLGQTWNGTTCSGRAWGYAFKDAQTATAPSSEGFSWRIPRPDELASLVVAGAACASAIDQDVFPRTLPALYWTGQAHASNRELGYCQSFAPGVSESERQTCLSANALAVRLVSVLPAGGYSPPVPTASSFAVDDSGNYLVVTGSNFSTALANNVVNFPTANGVRPIVPASGTSTSLKVAIPDETTTGRITVTTKGITSGPALGTLRVINNKEGCSAAGLTTATISQSSSSWDYCVLTPGFKDDPADAMIIGALQSKLPPTQQYFVVSTSPLSNATAASFTMTGRIVLQYRESGLYGALVVHSNAGENADTFVSTGSLVNAGTVDNRGNFSNLGSFVNTGNGVILNSGVFTNNPAPGHMFTIATTGTAINDVSFSNTGKRSGSRARLRNLGTLVTVSGSTGIENSRADFINEGSLILQGAFAFANRAGSAPGTLTNNGSIHIRIATQPEGVPILTNEPGATIVNNSGGSITNAADWTLFNRGTIQNCGAVTGLPPGPTGYGACPVPKPRR